jgi:hypothetical protein
MSSKPFMGQRPAGIVVIALLNIILGAVFTVMGLSASTGFDGITVLAGAVSILVSIGLLGLRRWAWWLAVILYAINIIVGLTFSNPMMSIMGLLISTYLWSSGVRQAFGFGTAPVQPVVDVARDKAA